jgi:hypothetical protein
VALRGGHRVGVPADSGTDPRPYGQRLVVPTSPQVWTLTGVLVVKPGRVDGFLARRGARLAGAGAS